MAVKQARSAHLSPLDFGEQILRGFVFSSVVTCEFMLAFCSALNWIVTDLTLKTDVQFSFGPIWIALVSVRNQYSEMY